MAIDPICGMEVDEKTALSAEYEGQTFYFCNPACRKKFLSDRGIAEATAGDESRSEAAVGPPSTQATTKATLSWMSCAGWPLGGHRTIRTS